MGQRVRGISKASYAWRIAATVLGIGLLLNGSLRMSDDAWPFGPLSQYAFSPAKDTTIVITRAEGLLADGRRIAADYVNLGTAILRGATPDGRMDIPWQDIEVLRFTR